MVEYIGSFVDLASTLLDACHSHCFVYTTHKLGVLSYEMAYRRNQARQNGRSVAPGKIEVLTRIFTWLRGIHLCGRGLLSNKKIC